MAKIKVKKRKELQNIKKSIDLTELDLGVIEYIPLSTEINELYRELHEELEKRQQKVMLNELEKTMKVNRNSFSGNVQEKLLNSIGFVKFAEMQNKVATDFGLSAKFMHSIPGMPTREEIFAALETMFEEDYLIEDTYYSLVNDFYSEYKEVVEAVNEASEDTPRR